MRSESLSFTVTQVASNDDLLRACAVRAEAYGRRAPEYAEKMSMPDSIDECPWTTNYLCEDKSSGLAIGTMRIQTAVNGGALEIEKYASLPSDFTTYERGEISRLSASRGADPLVRLALWKVGYLHCISSSLRWLILGVRKPGLLRAYLAMGAKEIAESVPLPYAGNLLHRVLGLNVLSAAEDWENRNHPLLAFMTGTTHPDVCRDSVDCRGSQFHPHGEILRGDYRTRALDSATSDRGAIATPWK